MEEVRIYILMIWNFMHINGEIMCNYHLLPWKSAITLCQHKTGVPVSSNQIHIPYGISNDASFWTAEYATRELYVSSKPENPVSCGYKTLKFNMFGSIEFGDCGNEKHFICCPTHQFDEQCVQTGTWQRAILCTTIKYADSDVFNMVPDGDYWVAKAYAYDKNTLHGDINKLQMPDQCGSVHSNGILQFENNCSSLRYSMCDLPDLFINFAGFSECDPANVPTTTKSVSPTDRPTAWPNVITTISSTRTLLSKTTSMLTSSATMLTTIRTSSRSTSRIQPYKLTSSSTLLKTIRTSPRSISRIQPYKLTSSATSLTTIRTRSRSTSRIQAYIKTEQYAVTPTRTTVSPSFSNNVSNLNIGLGVGLGGFVIIVVVVGLSCYIRRNMTRSDADKRTASALAEMNAAYGVSENRVDLTLNNPCQNAAHNDTYYSNSAVRHVRNLAGYEETCIDRNGAHVAHQENHRKGNAKSHTKKTSSKYKDHLKSGTNELKAACNVAMNTLYFTSNEREGLDHEYCNTNVMSDQYDGVHFAEAPDSVTLNDYSHIGFGKQYDHDENDYNVASSTNEQATPYMRDYDRLK